MSIPPELRLPEGLTSRAQAVIDGDEAWEIPPTRDASTVILLRPGAASPEVFLMRRVSTMAFAAGFHVFPGGAVDPDDRVVPMSGDEALLEVQRRFVVDAELATALVAAAARETFEECGVLIVDREVDAADWEGRRQALLAGEATFSALLIEAGLTVDAAALVPWTHWVTPEVEPRRYDTRFFVTALPAGQEARDLGGEADRVHWVAASEALERFARSELAMMPPTVEAISGLLGHDTPDAAVAAAAARTIRPLTPTPHRADDGSIEWVLRDARTGEAVTDIGPLGGRAG